MKLSLQETGKTESRKIPGLPQVKHKTVHRGILKVLKESMSHDTKHRKAHNRARRGSLMKVFSTIWHVLENRVFLATII